MTGLKAGWHNFHVQCALFSHGHLVYYIIYPVIHVFKYLILDMNTADLGSHSIVLYSLTVALQSMISRIYIPT